MTERASRKPIPRTMRGWSNEVKGLQRVIAGYESLKIDNGVKWVDSMTAYAKERLAVLNDHKPVIRVRKRK